MAEREASPIMPFRSVTPIPGTSSRIAIALQTAGLLSALIFLITATFEVLVINDLYASQHALIALLAGVLSLWALLEVLLIKRHRSIAPLRNLKIALAIQVVVITIRHWSYLRPAPAPDHSLVIASPSPEFNQAILFAPIHLLLFLAISKFLIDAFAYAERLRANQLQEQMILLHQTKAALQISENRYSLIADNVNDVIWTVDNAGHFTFISPSLTNLSGHATAELIGQPLINQFSPDSGAILKTALHQSKDQGLPGEDVPVFRAELEQLRNDGFPLWVEITMNSLYNDRGSLVGYVGVTRDIETRKLYERNLRDARDAAEEANLALLSANARLHGQVTTDMLTGLCNRNHFENVLKTQIENSRAHGEKLCLLLMDLDNFRSVNERYGHSLGDLVLSELARLLQSHLRKHDVLARWNGDQFMLMLPNTRAQEAFDLAKQIGRDTSVHSFPAMQHLTLSIGVAELLPQENLSDWLERVESILKTAKNSGCNAVKLSG
jgi:diguanylate cyclase (GGDEF)-like protein/PAS domain S-box-containing protein